VVGEVVAVVLRVVTPLEIVAALEGAASSEVAALELATLSV